ncbi:MAG: 8-oxoguanine deaminase [Hyphomicrobiaceae bacterium]|nr:8-oxoguanine deaminase [Hyphomicrobiaceae bacterium]
MSTLLIKNATVIVTMDDARRELKDTSLYAIDGVISALGPAASLPAWADRIIDAHDHVAVPGFVNTHHHLVQNLTRAVPAAQDAPLFGWLKALYPIWANLTPDHVYSAVALGLAELALSGCTTSSDHLYLFPNGSRLDDEIRAARDVGVRFTATRGSMSIGESKGGLPPDRITESEPSILRDCERLIDTYHDASRHAMLNIALAPCSPFSVSRELMRDTAILARQKGVRLHTHLAENVEDIAYSLEKFGVRPGQYAEDLGWVGHDVWHAHCVQLDASEIELFGRTGTGIAHCPCSNMRLASGIAPIGAMLRAHVPIGLGVDGSASNDSGHMLNEVRQTMLLQRVKGDAGAMSARTALELATRGGARVLGRSDIGHLAPGMSADVCLYNLNTIDFAGADWDPVAALVFCGPAKSTYTVINGRVVVDNGRLTTMDLPKLVTEHRRLTRQLMTTA